MNAVVIADYRLANILWLKKRIGYEGRDLLK
jgi:hypothetical protein